MYAGRTIFAQVMDVLPLRRFHTCVERIQRRSGVPHDEPLDCMSGSDTLTLYPAFIREMLDRIRGGGMSARVARTT